MSKKYQGQWTINRTLTFYKEDLDVLEANRSTQSVTDHLQQAIKEYIKRHGLTTEGPGTKESEEPGTKSQAPPQFKVEVTEANDLKAREKPGPEPEEDDPLPPYLR